MAITLNLFRNGAVGFIDGLDAMGASSNAFVGESLHPLLSFADLASLMGFV